MSRCENLASYLETLLGYDFAIKYYSNKPEDWSEILLDDEMCYGSIKVVGDTNQSLSDINISVDEFALTLMIPKDKYAETIEGVEESLETINKTNVLIGSDYSLFLYSNRQDLGDVIYNGMYRSTVTIYFSLTTYTDLLLGDVQYLQVNTGSDYVQLQGKAQIIYDVECQYDGAVTSSAYQKNYLSSINEALVYNGVVVTTDTALAYIKAHLKDNTTFALSYYDGIDTITLDAKIASYTQEGISGNFVKVNLKFIQKG